MLTYRVDWPLSVVISEQSLTQYQLVFRHLFELKYVERELNTAWRVYQTTKALPRYAVLMMLELLMLQMLMLVLVVPMLMPTLLMVMPMTPMMLVWHNENNLRTTYTLKYTVPTSTDTHTHTASLTARCATATACVSK